MYGDAGETSKKDIGIVGAGSYNNMGEGFSCIERKVQSEVGNVTEVEESSPDHG